jgi:hypothetical protein
MPQESNDAGLHRNDRHDCDGEPCPLDGRRQTPQQMIGVEVIENAAETPWGRRWGGGDRRDDVVADSARERTMAVLHHGGELAAQDCGPPVAIGRRDWHDEPDIDQRAEPHVAFERVRGAHRRQHELPAGPKHLVDGPAERGVLTRARKRAWRGAAAPCSRARSRRGRALPASNRGRRARSTATRIR